MEKTKEWPATIWCTRTNLIQHLHQRPADPLWNQELYLRRRSMYHGPVAIIHNMTEYYQVNSLRANPEKNTVTAFHLRNKEAKRSLRVMWNKTKLDKSTHTKYLGVTLDKSLNYKQHIRNTKMKVATRNYLLTKLATSKWGANPSTIRTTVLALSYSTAEYAAPVWARSAHAKNLDPELNQVCRSVTGCLKLTNVEDLYLLSEEMSVPEWRDRNNQPERLTLCLVRCLKSRHCFLSGVQPANFPAKVIRCSEWRKRLRNKSHIDIINFHEELAKDYDSPWTTWRCINRLRTAGILAAKHKGKSGSSAQETPHVFVEKQKKPWHTCYSSPNSHIPAL